MMNNQQLQMYAQLGKSIHNSSVKYYTLLQYFAQHQRLLYVLNFVSVQE